MTEPARQLANPHSPQAAAAGARAFVRIMAAWAIPDDEASVLAGLPSVLAFATWRLGDVVTLTEEQLCRTSYVLGIYKALQLVLSDAAQADAWVSKPNDAFGGISAKQCMLDRGVEGMADVRRYLDHVRGGRS
jgi:antitoxin Xre/MbcA/ParS-like protein